MRIHGSRVLRASCAGLLAVLLVGCSDEQSGPESATAESTPSAPPAVERVDPSGLPVGPPPRIDAIAGHTIYRDGRAVRLSLPARVSCHQLMGDYAGRTILAAGIGGEGDQNQFYGVDADGRAEALGGLHPI